MARLHLVIAVLLALAPVGAPRASRAASPVGSWVFWFGGNASIWIADDVSDVCELLEAELALLDCSASFQTDGRGRGAGFVTLTAEEDGLLIDLSGEIKARVKGDASSGLTHLRLTLKMDGSATDGFQSVRVKLKVRGEATVTSSGELSGLVSVKACAKGVGCMSGEGVLSDVITTPGYWLLDLTVTDVGDGRLGGGAVVTFGNGATCQFGVSGKYSARKDEASLKLVPGEACRGSKIQLKQVRTAGSLDAEISYKLIGYKGRRLPVQAMPPAPPSPGGVVTILLTPDP